MNLNCYKDVRVISLIDPNRVTSYPPAYEHRNIYVFKGMAL